MWIMVTGMSHFPPGQALKERTHSGQGWAQAPITWLLVESSILVRCLAKVLVSLPWHLGHRWDLVGGGPSDGDKATIG